MRRRRVKITGIGPVTPAGIGKDAFWSGILEPVSRVRPFSKLGDEFGPFVAAYITSADVLKQIGAAISVPKGSARHTIFAVAGAILALRDAGVMPEELRRASCAVVTGSSLLDFGGIGTAIESVQKRGTRGVQSRVVYTTTLSAVPQLISEVLEIDARTMTIQTSCCAGLDAIGHAAELVATGEVEYAICGGTESPLHRFPLLELRAAGLTPLTTDMPERISRPFDLWRTTGVVSEGAAMFLVEPESSRRKGYSFITGYAFANDSRDDICGGLVESAELALAAARLRPHEIDSLNAWGPGHRTIDQGEARAMQVVFNSWLSKIPAVSIKGALGAALGAAPAMQVATAALSHATGIIPPTVNWEYPDPDCPLNLCARARAVDHERTLVNAHGVGNINACLVLQRC